MKVVRLIYHSTTMQSLAVNRNLTLELGLIVGKGSVGS